jgi:hypothetical protein
MAEIQPSWTSVLELYSFTVPAHHSRCRPHRIPFVPSPPRPSQAPTAAARPRCRHLVVRPFATAIIPLLLHSTSPAAVSVAAGQWPPPSRLSLHRFCCCTPGLCPPPLPVSHLLASATLSASLSATCWYVITVHFSLLLPPPTVSPSQPALRSTPLSLPHTSPRRWHTLCPVRLAARCCGPCLLALALTPSPSTPPTLLPTSPYR